VEFVTFETDELSIWQSALDVSVAKHFHDVENVFCFGVLGCGFPVSECVEGDFADAVVLEFGGNFGSLYVPRIKKRMFGLGLCAF
jgi:hypothetical protein